VQIYLSWIFLGPGKKISGAKNVFWTTGILDQKKYFWTRKILCHKNIFRA
jgi:hypothetical protein